MFELLWKHGGLEDFQTRLKQTIRKGDIVVNSCTKGNLKHVELRKLVQAAIVSATIDALLLNRCHPYSWFDASLRNYEWK